MSLLDKLSSNYEMMWKAFIQPPRYKYSLSEICQERRLLDDGKTLGHRINFTVKHKGIKLYSTLVVPTHYAKDTKYEDFKPNSMPSGVDKTACVVYFHSHTGC